MMDKVLNIVVTRNNPVLLQHMFESFKRFDPGYDCDFLIVDNSSDSPIQKKILDKLSTSHSVMTAPNGRVESSFDLAWRKYKGYKYYFFLHDDECANKDNWLKVFVDRMNGGYVEDIIKGTELEKLPIGKVGAQSQFWRSYDSVLGYSVQCLFLKAVLDVIRPGKAPQIFKYCDCDRVLIRAECLEATNGLRHLAEFKDMEKATYDRVCDALRANLQYPDEGIPPKDQYPPGECWNKMCLTSEMMNSVEPLIHGWRTVGLEGDGYLEQIHGYDVMWGNNYIHHYGSPNFREHIARIFGTDKEEVKKHFSEKAFLLKMDRIVKEHFK